MITGLRRSALFVPCDMERMLEKAFDVPADLLLLNLEDGVAASKKDAARAQAIRALTTRDFGPRELVVRINSLDSEVGRCDLQAIVPCRPDGICLPKIESAHAVAAADQMLGELECKHALPAGSVKLHAMIESAAGMLCAQEIAAASGRMASLIFGSADYSADLRCLPGEDRMEMLLALQMIVAGARTASIDAIDAPCFDLHNSDLLRCEAAQARRLGFDGKSALRPGQLAILNKVFDVTEEEKVRAETVLEELAGAEARGRSLSTFEGCLIDNPHRCAAERILRRARLSKKWQERP
jgi:citrate lyase subunit beta / citryl-CoA lyase